MTPSARENWVVVASALLLALARAPWSLAPLAWFALAPFLLVLVRPTVSARRGAGLGFLFGIVLNAAVLYWFVLLDPTSRFARPWLLVPGFLGLLGFLALPWSLTAYLVARSRRALGVCAIFWLPALVPWVEWLQAQGEWAFPWCSLSAGQTSLLPVSQLASVVGGIGLSVWVALVNTQVALVATGVKRMHALVFLGALLAAVFPGAQRAERAASAWDRAAATMHGLRVALVQPHVAPTVKWDRIDYSVSLLERLTTAAARSRPDLIVWPETAVPLDVLQRPALLDSLSSCAGDAPLLCGFPSLLSGGRYANSVALVRHGSVVGRYGKQKLLPVGERVPAVVARAAARDGATFVAAPTTRPLAISSQHRLGLLVCSESTFAALARHHALDGANLLVNVVNDGWFGRGAASQHAEHARLRALETGLPLLRCANNGPSFVCGPGGGIRGIGAPGARGVVEAILPPADPTLYAIRGDAPILAASAALIFILATLGRARSTAGMRAT